MKRRFVITGNIGQQDLETGEIIPSGGVIVLDDKDARTVGLVDAGALALESDQPESVDDEMRCPLCTEQGEKTVPTFADEGELAAHYADRHPGFAVPEWEGR